MGGYIMNDKYTEIINNLANGNYSDFETGIKKLKK
jgi:hypothetical protein